ncbi:hypothetical protein FRC00_002256 [Tulasnella sp. 408]|nr:hypothetical protein FRC00_002256 [Tulasnella sp. 408]
MGWDEEDFPMWDSEFKDLVLKNQKLTPKIWQNIRPKLESILETRRNNLLEMQRRQRRSQRDSAIGRFYGKLAVEVLDLSFHRDDLTFLLPKLDEGLAPPSIKSLLTNDTETVSEDQWIEVAPEARLFLLRWWRDCLKQLTARLEDGATASVENTKTRFKATYSKAETVEAISESIEELRAKLSYVTSAFVCGRRDCGKVFWFPDFISHAWSSHYSRSMDEITNTLESLRPDGQDLVKRLLKELKLDPETAKVCHPAEEKSFLCTRCDERVAKYMSLTQMIDHFIGAQRWFENATEAVRKSPDSCYPSRTVNSQLPKIVNDHDWISRDALLVRQDDQQAKEAVFKLQRNFEIAFRKHPRGEVKRHDKEPDLEKDTALGSLGPPSGNGKAKVLDHVWDGARTSTAISSKSPFIGCYATNHPEQGHNPGRETQFSVVFGHERPKLETITITLQGVSLLEAQNRFQHAKDARVPQSTDLLKLVNDHDWALNKFIWLGWIPRWAERV